MVPKPDQPELRPDKRGCSLGSPCECHFRGRSANSHGSFVQCSIDLYVTSTTKNVRITTGHDEIRFTIQWSSVEN